MGVLLILVMAVLVVLLIYASIRLHRAIVGLQADLGELGERMGLFSRAQLEDRKDLGEMQVTLAQMKARIAVILATAKAAENTTVATQDHLNRVQTAHVELSKRVKALA